jgi:hypothetical protein
VKAVSNEEQNEPGKKVTLCIIPMATPTRNRDQHFLSYVEKNIKAIVMRNLTKTAENRN